MKMKLMAAALAVALLGCLLFAYLWIDRSISLNYMSQSVDGGAADITNPERLLESSWGGMPESAVLAMLQTAAARYPTDIDVKEEDGAIWFGGTRFVFEQGKLKRVGGR